MPTVVIAGHRGDVSPTVSSVKLLSQLQIRDEHPAGFRRSAFAYWTTPTGRSCDTSVSVLLRDAESPARARNCMLIEGRWTDALRASDRLSPQQVSVEQLVPIEEAWRSGASQWSPTTRAKFANDVEDTRALLVTSQRSSQQRGSRDPSLWQPNRGRCEYVSDWIAVKFRWNLSVDRDEARSLSRALTACGERQAVPLPIRAQIAYLDPPVTPVPYEEVLTSEATPGGGDAIADAATLLSGIMWDRPDDWGGMYVDAAFLVAVTTLPIDEAQKVLTQAGLADLPVVVRQSDVSLTMLEVASDRSLEAVRMLGIGGASIGPQYGGDDDPRVVIGIATDNLDLRTSLAYVEESSGVEVVTYRTNRNSALADAYTDSRYYYTSPFYGGATIWPRGGGFVTRCTATGPWEDGGKEFLITAGHCIDLLAGKTVDRKSPAGDFRQIGVVSWVSGTKTQGTYSGRQGDLAAVLLDDDKRAGNRTFVGSADTTDTRKNLRIVTLPEGWTGDNLATSGSTTGELRFSSIRLTNQRVSYPDNPNAYFTNMTYAYKSGADCIDKGDSGGVVWTTRPDDYAAIAGVISGYSYGVFPFAECDVIFTPLEAFQSQRGGSLVRAS